MQERLDYIFEAFYKALHKSWGKASMTGIVLSFFIGIILYAVYGWNDREFVMGTIIACCTFLIIFLAQFNNELRAVFPNLLIEKMNHVAEARIVIHNKELADFTDLKVELFKYKRVFLNGETEEGTISHEDRFFKIEDGDIISYDGGTKVVVIASGESGNPFLGNMLETDCECYEGWHHLIYDVVIKVKGRVDGRIVRPKEVNGRLKYTKSCEKTYAYIQGNKVETSTSRFQWESLAQ